MGSSLALVYINKQDHTIEQGSHSVNSINDNLEEALWNVELIIKGTVLNEGNTYKKDAGIQGKQNFSFDVTPANIKVDKVLYGIIDTNSITYLQHGSSSNSLESKNHVKKGEEVVLMLVKTDE
ncbi:hypothetical protein GCM10008018_15750 [Paenibacillus marchantiophytorum]|uniref:Uncharacterized protein n=1 Tax=Paenibacillus marchantiophytorum TaxID=1619310 RepID=A0ABQ2BRW3_9BACL|nr:hypothetical protein GCM10008018_15750 [Paenibacillus marchantiophytorum]